MVDEGQLCLCASSKIYILLLFFTVKTISRRVSMILLLVIKVRLKRLFFLFFIFFDVGVALVPRPLFKSSSILCQET